MLGPGFESVTPGVLILIMVMLYRYFTQLFDCSAVNWTKYLIGICVLMVIANIAKISFFNPGHISNSFVLEKGEEIKLRGQKITKKSLSKLLKKYLEDHEELLECEKCLILTEQAQKHKIVHCEECDICVQGFDHHCGVLGNCIGKQNIKNFNFLAWSFVITVITTYGALFLALACCGQTAFGNSQTPKLN